MTPEFIYDKKYVNITFKANDISFREFENCVFTNCDLTQCSFLAIMFIDCEFINCNFKEAEVNLVALRNVNFENCNLTKVNFAMIDQTIFAFTMNNCNLEFTQFYGLKLKKQIFSNCSLISADFMDCDLTMAMFDNCNLHRAVFTKANCERADFYTSYNYDIDPAHTKIKKAIFSRDGLAGLLTKHQLVLK